MTNLSTYLAISPINDWIDVAPWRDRSLFLLHITPGGAVTQAFGLEDKRRLLSQDGGTLLAGWTGRWKTEVRSIADAADREAVAARVG